MELNNISRLIQEQQKGLDNCLEKIKKWENFKKDYEFLKQRLQTLSDKVTHDIMVPFGPQAFMPGKLIHTNELTVLLGDNWFVERSSKQSMEIVDRRIEQCRDHIEKLDKERKLFEDWLQHTSDVQSGEAVEIVEEYDEEKEKQWRIQHAKNVRLSRLASSQRNKQLDEKLEEMFDKLATKEMESESMNPEEQKIEERKPLDSTDAIKENVEEQKKQWLMEHQKNMKSGLGRIPLAARIKQRKVMERKHRELMRKAEEEEYEASIVPNSLDLISGEKKKVRWEKICIPTIYFKHTPTEDIEPDFDKTAEILPITSPSDIYRIFSPRPKPILKKSTFTHSDIIDGPTKSSPVQELPPDVTNEVPFSGEIREHEVESEATVPVEKKKVSKFKKDRSKTK